MSAQTLCPHPELDCDACVQEFFAEHPGLELWRHTNHLHCDCPMMAHPPDDFTATVCVGCGEKRDLAAEFAHGMAGAA